MTDQPESMTDQPESRSEQLQENEMKVMGRVRKTVIWVILVTSSVFSMESACMEVVEARWLHSIRMCFTELFITQITARWPFIFNNVGVSKMSVSYSESS